MAKTNSGLLEFKDAQKVLIALDDATSEVKKAVVIDADGVETDIAGVQPTGKKEITSTAEVNVADYATAQVVDPDLVAGNIKKDVDILGVVGTYEAAASDLTTADVIFYNSAEGKYYTVLSKAFACISDYDTIVENTEFNVSEQVSAKIVIYQGSQFIPLTKFLAFDEQTMPIVTGNIEFVTSPSYGFIVTGDGTITAKGSGSVN